MCMCLCMCMRMCMYEYVYACVFVCVCVCVYASVEVATHIDWNSVKRLLTRFEKIRHTTEDWAEKKVTKTRQSRQCTERSVE